MLIRYDPVRSDPGFVNGPHKNTLTLNMSWLPHCSGHSVITDWSKKFQNITQTQLTWCIYNSNSIVLSDASHFNLAILVLSDSWCKQSVQNHEGFWPSDPKTTFRAKQRSTLSAHKIVNLIPLNRSQIIFAPLSDMYARYWAQIWIQLSAKTDAILNEAQVL